jgi:heavy metal sensor kinase
MHMKLRSLRVRLTLWVLFLLCLIQLGVSAIFYIGSSQWLQDQIDHSLYVTATQITTVISEEGDPLDQGDINFQFDEGGIGTQSFLREQRFFVRLVEQSTGRIIETSTVNDVPVSTISQSIDQSYETVHTANSDTMRIFTVRLHQNPQFAIQVGVSLNGMLDTQEQILRLLVGVFIVTVALSVASGWFVGTRALLPIRGITRTAQEINARDFDRRLDLHTSDDELKQLMRTFNDMLDRLQRAFQQQRQFTADAAHELRTPLSIMQTGLDVMLSQKRTVGQYQTSLESVREEVQRLTQLANSLLMLARADAHELPLHWQWFDLSLLLETVLDQLSLLAKEKHIQMERNITPRLELYADEDRMIQVALNLLENALKYAPQGGTVHVDATRIRHTIQFAVGNTGAAIPQNELAHIFDRFYRADPSRNRERGGFGLGLAITKQLIELQGGTILVESSEQTGTIFTVRFPMREKIQIA